MQPARRFIDSVLNPVCQQFYHRADEILDLRDCAIQRILPGRCVHCYFKLSRSSDSFSAPALSPLRQWLESNIEVVATDAGEQVLEQIPLKLDASDLDEYCHEVIGEFRENRAYGGNPLTLEFRYKAA